VANEDKSARYHRLRRRTALLDTAAQAVLLLGLLSTGAAAALRTSLESIAGTSLVPLAASYVLALAAVSEAVHLPFAVYQGVVLERRFGLSRESAARWMIDHVKAAGIALVFMMAAGVVVTLLLQWSPTSWWILSAAGFAAALVLIAHYAPIWLLPIFYEVRPLDRAALRARLIGLAEKAGTPVLGAFEWRLGDRTSKANAALVGLGRTRRILVSDTLLAAHSDEEIETVFAHELAHHVYGDIWSALALDVVLVAIGLYVADVVLESLLASLDLRGKADVAALPLLVLAVGAVSILLRPLANMLSRAHERRADRYALETTRNSAAFISAMKRLAATNLAEERPSRVVELFFHTHPSALARIEAARNWALGSRLSALGTNLERPARDPEGLEPRAQSPEPRA
jgi:STE24 endopeptidase